MARPRAPRLSAIALALARILGMGASVVLLANLIFESVNWEKTLALSITVAVIALIVDGSELMGLLDSTRTIPRASPACVVSGDVAVLSTAIPSIFLIMLSGRHGTSPNEPYPWEATDSLSLIITFAICGLRFVLLVWSCVDCCSVIRQPRHRGNRMARVEPTDELQEVVSSSS